MSSIIRVILFSALLFSLLAMASCTDDPTIPPRTEDFRVDLISPYHTECPDAPFTVVAQANRPLQRVEFIVDGEIVTTVYQEPFEFLWNINLWADSGYHFLLAYAFDAEGNSAFQGNVAFHIPYSVAGILLSPPLNGGIPESAEATLRWRNDPTALDYEVALNLSPDFSGGGTTVTATDTTATIATTEHQWQYWRIRPRTTLGQWGLWSETSVFYGGQVFCEEDPLVEPGPHEGKAVEPMTNGDYVVAGTNDLFPLAARFDNMGQLLWTYSPSFYGQYLDLVATDDGGCLLAGLANFGGPSNLLLTRLDPEGIVIWSHSVFGSEESDAGLSICRCEDGSYLVAGSKAGAAWLLKFDEQGWLIWENTYLSGSANAVLERSGGGFAFTGANSSNDLILVGISSEGTEQFRVTIDWGNDARNKRGIALVADGTGFTTLGALGYLHKFDEVGQLQDSISVGYDNYSDFVKTADGHYVIASRSDLIGMDSSWQETWRHPLNFRASAVQQTDDSGFIITGQENSDLWLLKTAHDGSYLPTSAK